MVGVAPDGAIGEAQVQTPRRTQHIARGIGFGETLWHRSIAAHLTGRQIAEPHLVSQRSVLGDEPADANLDVVRVRTNGQEIHGRKLVPSGSVLVFVSASGHLERADVNFVNVQRFE